jgi:UV DNA damage endonuclease
MHADILDMMKIDHSGIICVHGGGTYGDKENAIRRWIEQFDDLPKNVKKRLAIENCEKSYSVSDCVYIAEQCNISMIFDSHHYDCYSILHPNEIQDCPEDLIPQVVDTWKKLDRNPVMHISEQAPNKRIGAHSDYIEKIPQYMLNLPEEYNCTLHIEVEAKAKEKAIKKIKENYPHLLFD